MFADNTWMNWVMLAAIVVCIPVFALFPENYQRFDIDTEKETAATENSEASVNPRDIQTGDRDPLVSHIVFWSLFSFLRILNILTLTQKKK